MKIQKIVLIVYTLLLFGCSAIKNVTTIGVDVISKDLKNSLKSQINFQDLGEIDVISEQLIKGEIIINVNFKYRTISSNIDAHSTITYVKNLKIWIVSRIETINISIQPTVNPVDASALEVVLNEPGPYFSQAFEYLFYKDKVSLISKEFISNTETKYIFEYKDSQSIWSIDQTYTVSAKYDLQNEWVYTISDWHLEEVCDWAGTWQAKLYDYDHKLLNTIDNIVITGKLSVTDNMIKGRVVQDTLQATFLFNGVSVSSTPIIVDKFRQTNVIVLRTGTGPNDWFWMGLGIVGPVVPGNTYFYAVGSQNDGDLIKLK